MKGFIETTLTKKIEMIHFWQYHLKLSNFDFDET